MRELCERLYPRMVQFAQICQANEWLAWPT